MTKQHRSLGVSEDELVKIAVKSMGLDDLKPFNPKEKIIEYMLEAESSEKKLVDMTCVGFANETASESPAPGGGSISAYMASLGAALGTMAANLSSHKPGWDDRWEEFSKYAEIGQKLKDELMHLVDEDTRSFNKIMEAINLPKGTAEEKAARKAAMQAATQYAIEVPFKTMEKAAEVLPLCKAMAEIGNPNSVSDAGVGALAATAGVRGAFLNVKINAGGIEDKEWANKIIAKAQIINDNAIKLEAEIMAQVEKVLQVKSEQANN